MQAPSHMRGFTFLELVLVISLITLLFAFSARQYQKHVDESKKEVIFFQAQAFKRSIDNVHAISTLKHSGVVDMGQGRYIFMHASGWPYAAAGSAEAVYDGVSSETCGSLWQALFTSANRKNDNSSTKAKDDFEFIVIDNYICRYKRFGKQEESYFFDYDVRTGNVAASTHSD